MDEYDKARKPYTVIDTSSPAGTWVEEKHYNRSRPSGSNARKVLCGNWQEEKALEDDMLQREEAEKQRTMQLTQSTGNAPTVLDSTFHMGASIDVVKDKGNGHYAGGFKSTPYLTTDARNPDLRELQSTYRTGYNADTSDTARLKRPELGVRSQLMLQQALAAAEQEQKEEEARRRMQASTAVNRASSRNPVGGASTNLEAAGGDESKSVYYASMCDGHHEVLETIDALSGEYLTDEPITVYTGNPNTGKTMTVHGKTPCDPVATTRFGKHTYFSEPKYTL